MKLSQEQLEQYEKNGFLIVERIIDDETVEGVSTAMTRVYNGIYNRGI